MNPNRSHQTLKRWAHNRLALSTVVTTLIVLVVSVLLAGVVTYFAINVTSTRVQEESLVLAKQHIWFDAASGTTQAAIMVINTGGRDVVVDRLTVRGQECAWSKVYFTTVGDSVSGDLSYNLTLIDGGTISVGGSSRVFEQASNDLTVKSGNTLIMYIHNPDSISVNDIGLTVSINIFTSQAMYYKETNVQGTSGTTTSTPAEVVTPDVEIVYASAYNVLGLRTDIVMVVRNNGDDAQTFELLDATGDGVLCTTDGDSHFFACGGVTTVTDELHQQSYSVGSIEIQTYTLNEQTGTVTLGAGETAIVYFMGIHTAIEHLEVGDPALVGINFNSGLEVTKPVTVKANEL